MFQVEVLTEGTELTPLQLRAAFRAIGFEPVPPGDTVLTDDQCLVFWVFLLLTKLKFLDPEQRTVLFEEMVGSLDDLAKDIIAGRVITPMVVIADSRYATWHNRNGWLDLINGESVTAPQHPALETVAFNLAVLFLRNRRACEELNRRKEARDDNTA